MAQCITVNASGQLETSTADPCTTLVVLTPAEYAAVSANPFNLSPEDGALISGAVIGVWCIAWACRALQRVLSTDGESQD